MMCLTAGGTGRNRTPRRWRIGYSIEGECLNGEWDGINEQRNEALNPDESMFICWKVGIVRQQGSE